MRNAALTLGVIAGVIGLIVGFFGYGYVVFIEWFGEVEDIAEQVANPQLVQAAALISPILAIAGGAMARSQNVAAGVLLLLSAAGMYIGFNFNVFTMFPIAMSALGGIFALLARQPDTA